MATAIADQLAVKIGSARFNLWFAKRNSIVKHQDSDSIVIFAEDSFSLQRIQNTFGQELRQVVNCVCGPQFEIKFEISLAGNQDSADSAAELETTQISQQLSNTETSTPPVPTILHLHGDQPSVPAPNRSGQPTRRALGVSSFWFGTKNRLIQTGVDQLFEQPGQFSPLFVYGSTGSGKTHLLESIINDFRRRLKRKRCIFLSAEQFTSQFVGSLRGGSGLPMFRRKYRDLDILAIDDIQFLAGKRATLGEFQHTIDNLVRTGKQVIVSSDRPPIELGQLGDDVAARLQAGLTCPLEYPDLDGRMHIAKRLCSDRNFALPTNVLRLICEQLTRDVRRLSGAINRLYAYSVSMNQTITPELTHQVLCDLFSLSGPNCTSMVSIEQAVCEFCGIQPNDLKSSSRRKKICSARMLAMYLSRQYTGSAFSEIGDYFGGRSHSTVIAAERKVASWIEKNEGISVSHAVYPAKEVLRRIESNLRIG